MKKILCACLMALAVASAYAQPRQNQGAADRAAVREWFAGWRADPKLGPVRSKILVGYKYLENNKQILDMLKAAKFHLAAQGIPSRYEVDNAIKIVSGLKYDTYAIIIGTYFPKSVDPLLGRDFGKEYESFFYFAFPISEMELGGKTYELNYTTDLYGFFPFRK